MNNEKTGCDSDFFFKERLKSENYKVLIKVVLGRFYLNPKYGIYYIFRSNFLYAKVGSCGISHEIGCRFHGETTQPIIPLKCCLMVETIGV